MSRLLSQLAHVELITPRPDESLKFFTDVMGLIETARGNNSVYLRGWGSHLHHELVLTEGPAPALGHIGWRAAGPYELEVAVERLETGGAGVGWNTDTVGHGPAFHGQAGPAPPRKPAPGSPPTPAQPRPIYGIAVAITVANCTFAPSGRAAIWTTVRATSAASITGSGLVVPSACGTPCCIRAVISVAALPMSIWPQAMP